MPVKMRVSTPLELIHSDMCSPVDTAIGGGWYTLLFLDDCTRWTMCYRLFHKWKVLAKFNEWVVLAEKTYSTAAQKVKKFRTDGRGESTSHEFVTYLEEEGITKEIMTRHMPQSNGVVEIANCTIFGCGQSMLEDAGLSKKDWPFAVETAV
jgi:hypothetical protein